jgi:drug/metabolite transporter (DMT)-like permease
MKLTHRRAVWLMVLVTLLWSTAGVVTRQLEQARSFEITFWRSFFTALSLLLILPLMQGRSVFARMASAGKTLWWSGLCWSVMFTAFMLALTLTSVANVLVTLAIGPFLTAVVARVFIGHRIAAHTWAAIAVAGAGIAWMHGQQQNIDLVPAVLVGAVISSLATLPLALPWSASAHDLGWLAFLGLTQLAIPCVLSVLCASALKAPEISLLALLEVIFGIAWAWAGAGETPSSTVLTGGALVIGALVTNEWVGMRQRKS